MTAEPRIASDFDGLLKTAPLSRRGFMSASAAAAAGYTLAAGPVRAEAIKTDTTGLDAGSASVKSPEGEMPVYFARPANVSKPPDHSRRDGSFRTARIHQGCHAQAR